MVHPLNHPPMNLPLLIPLMRVLRLQELIFVCRVAVWVNVTPAMALEKEQITCLEQGPITRIIVECAEEMDYARAAMAWGAVKLFFQETIPTLYATRNNMVSIS